ncbi:type II toxin-antitoxin system VapC family toxin [Nitrospirillum viridazoti]|uniref:Ribonuclease VapC n=1 Tax=Nitrospirillum viridazoti CBAmc TaxID=1441467 RepID=A0A248JNS7_9PROT|nr:type II toxin-antitoxin system VapC family toxin [Nitrospirillum amazonense]ASG20176.1 VapC toxin family PIN domain ribonuclease [Nitrospirillum amazonense CBAmc]TWB29546.1 putative nucleic acid-binding protein [Nitrospirillum amazonense]
MSIVLDASMAVAWLFDDERTASAHTVMLRVVAEGAFVPTLWRLEVANVLRNAVRRGRCDEAYVDRSLTRLGRMAIQSDEETDSQAWIATRRLAREEDLTLYDAAYLELALRRGIPLASCDAALIVAAKRRGLEVLSA